MKRLAPMIVILAGVVLAVLLMVGLVWAAGVGSPDLGGRIVVPETSAGGAPSESPTPEATTSGGGSPSPTPTVRKTKAEPVKPPPPRRGGGDGDGDDDDDDDD